MKAMRRRIALQKHCVQNLSSALWYFIPRPRDFGSAHSLPACVRASSRRFQCGRSRWVDYFFLVLSLAIGVLCVTSCVTSSHHTFSDPNANWKTKTGQMMYRSPKATLIGDALVRFSNTGDFELTVSKGPGITLLSVRQDATFAEVKGGFARQGWSGPINNAPPQLRGWLALRDQLIRAPNQKTLRYATGDETFLFRF